MFFSLARLDIFVFESFCVVCDVLVVMKIGVSTLLKSPRGCKQTVVLLQNFRGRGNNRGYKNQSQGYNQWQQGVSSHNLLFSLTVNLNVGTCCLKESDM